MKISDTGEITADGARAEVLDTVYAAQAKVLSVAASTAFPPLRVFWSINNLPASGDRETFHRARLDEGGAILVSNPDSSAQKALAEADLLLRSRKNDPAREPGEEIEAISF